MARRRGQTDALRLADVAGRIYAALKARGAYGREAAVTQGEIAKLAGTTTRALQDASLALMEQGVPVATTCSQPCGMFIADSLTELQAYRDQLHARIVGNAKRMKAVNRIRREWTERMSIEPDGQRRLFA